MALELKKRPKKDAEAKAPSLANPDFVPAFPTVNVLPGNVLEIVEIANLKKKVVTAGVVVLIGLGLAWAAQSTTIALANKDLRAEQAATQGLNTEAAGLAPVQLYYEGVAGNATVVRSTMAKEVLHSNLVFGLYQQAQASGVSLGTSAITVDTTAAAPGAPVDAAAAGVAAQCPGPDPFNAKPAIGCITLVGTAPSRDAVGNYINALTATDLFVNPYVATTSADEEGLVSFNATVGVVEAAYSKRYSPENFLKGVGQ